MPVPEELQARRGGLWVLVTHDSVAVAVDEGRVDVRRRAFYRTFRLQALRRRTFCRNPCRDPLRLRSVQGGYLYPHARHEARPRGALARELRRMFGDVYAQREDLWEARSEEERAEVARVALAQLQAAECRVEQRRHFGGEAATVQARIRRLIRGRVRGRVRVGVGVGVGVGVEVGLRSKVGVGVGFRVRG